MKNRNLEHSNNRATPKSLLDALEKEFGPMFDPCPFMHDIRNRDGLQIERGGVNFINPPYSLREKVAFISKAIEESKKGKTCIMLLPVSTSTKVFHDLILPNKKEIRFLRGRVKFSGWNTKGEWVDNRCGMHDSMIVIF